MSADAAGALAVSAAAQTAATQQDSLAPLFANLGVAAGSNGLPPQVQQAVAQVLAQQTSLDQNLTGNDIKQAFQSSGLFLEASLASGSVSPSAGTPDLKAALIVLRQVLTTSLGARRAAAAKHRPRRLPVAHAGYAVPATSAASRRRSESPQAGGVAGARLWRRRRWPRRCRPTSTAQETLAAAGARRRSPTIPQQPAAPRVRIVLAATTLLNAGAVAR